MNATHLNIGSLADLVIWAGRANIEAHADGSITIPNGYPRAVWNAPSPAHIRRCVKMGLLVVVDKNTLRVTAEATQMITRHMMKSIRDQAWRHSAECKDSTDRLYLDRLKKTEEICAHLETRLAK
jgi:hypothetical protein